MGREVWDEGGKVEEKKTSHLPVEFKGPVQSSHFPIFGKTVTVTGHWGFENSPNRNQTSGNWLRAVRLPLYNWL